MKSVFGCSRLLPFLFFLIISLPLLAANAWQISRSIQSSQLQQSPQVLSVFIYQQEDAVQPVQVQHFERGQWQADVNLDNWPLAQDHIISFQAQLIDLEQTESQMLWIEVEVDSVLVGKRSLLRAAGTGGISTEGLVESRSVTEGGFKFPDGSIQTTAMDASCLEGSSIRSISPDGTVVCETDDVGAGGTVTSITAGSGLSGGTITTSGTIAVASGGIDESMLASNAVTSDKIAIDAVDTGAIVDENITTPKLADGAVNAAKINSNEVQRRVSGSCAAGQFIIAVNTDGTLVCAAIYDFLSIPPTISTLDDPVNNVGLYTSIAIGTDGYPVISYRDFTAGALKMIKCFKPECN